jgi:predicted esterase
MSLARDHLGALTALLVLTATPLWAQGAPSSAVPNEEACVRFASRHSLGSWAALKERIDFGPKRLARFGPEVEAAKSSFRVRLPKGYRAKGKRAYGLVVWMSPDSTGRCPPAWAGELRRKRLILVGPDQAGNAQPLARRIALALDAIQGARTNYRVDPERVFALGFSGGGNVASWLGLHFPDVFAGVALLSGCDTFRPVPVPDQPGSFWRGSIPEPSPEHLALAKERSQVFFSGKDDLLPAKQALAVSDLHRSLGFRRVTLRIAPGLAHRPCSGREMRRILTALEAPAKQPAPKASPAPTSRPNR